jgi:hypothetical protein
MAMSRSNGSLSIGRLIFVPTLISVVVTLLRLTGELLAWSESLFNPDAGGFGALVGITWLAPVFGIYFALHLSNRGLAPPRWGKAMGLVFFGMILLFGGVLVQAPLYMQNVWLGLISIWTIGVAAASFQYLSWPALFKTLLAYGLAARIPVVLIMFLAMWGQWGTHYDASPQGFPEMGWLLKFFWLGLLPQLLFWVSFTIVTGMFFGIVVAATAHRRIGSHKAVEQSSSQQSGTTN